MSCGRTESRLSDYLDGLLDAKHRRRIEAHLAGCPRCREALEAFKSLRRAVENLPRSIDPSRDLWPGIEKRILADKLVHVDFGVDPIPSPSTPPAWRRWASLAAAALVLVVLSSGITAIVMRQAADPTTADDEAAGAALVAGPAMAVEPIGPEYAVAVEELLWLLYEHHDEMDPETATVIETNLRVIDAAIRRARSALEEDPRNAELAKILTEQYRRKLGLLQQASRIIERS